MQVSNEVLAEVALGCPQLQRISISSCSSVTDAGVRGLAAGAPRLLAFVADDVGRLTDGCLLALGESCKSLQVNVPPPPGVRCELPLQSSWSWCQMRWGGSLRVLDCLLALGGLCMRVSFQLRDGLLGTTCMPL